MKDRLLRPALVGVSKKSEKNNNKEIKENDGDKNEQNQDKSTNK